MTDGIGWTRLSQRRLAEAVAHEREVLRLAIQLEYKTAFLRCCELLAIVLACCGSLERAAQLFGQVQVLTEELGTKRERGQVPLLAKADAQIRSGLTGAAHLEAMRAGRDADLTQLLEAALLEAETAIAAQPDSRAGLGA